jgi:hypothetical protein
MTHCQLSIQIDGRSHVCECGLTYLGSRIEVTTERSHRTGLRKLWIVRVYVCTVCDLAIEVVPHKHSRGTLRVVHSYHYSEALKCPRIS